MSRIDVFLQLVKMYVDSDIAERIEKIFDVFGKHLEPEEMEVIESLIPPVAVSYDINLFTMALVDFQVNLVKHFAKTSTVRLTDDLVDHIVRLGSSRSLVSYVRSVNRYIDKDVVNDIALDMIYLVRELISSTKEIPSSMLHDIYRV